jgi:hypothetical protein
MMSLEINAFANTMPEQINGEQLTAVANYIKKENKSFQNTIDLFSKIDKTKTEELKLFLKKNPSIEKLSIPNLIIENNNLIITLDGQKISFAVFNNGDVSILLGNKKIIVSFDMPFDQMINKISTELSLENKFSFLNLFISEANANPALILGLVMFSLPLIALSGILMAGKAGASLIKSGEKVCHENKDTKDGIDQQDLNGIKYNYNKISDAYATHCLAEKNFEENICLQFPKIKKCIKDIIMRADKSLGNNSSINKCKEDDHFPEIRLQHSTEK